MNTLPNLTYKPITYFALTIGITWASLFLAAFFSHTEALEDFMALTMLPSLLAPFGVALFMMYNSTNKILLTDFKRRLLNPMDISMKYWMVIIFLMPAVLILATFISLMFGQSIQQFSFSDQFGILKGALLISIAILFLTPAMEELGWRGYGMDSLMRGRSLIKASLIFTFLWGLWHVPLFFIKGYYHYEILQMNPVYAINFFVALLPVVIISNWIFYKNGRYIIPIIIFHFMLNFSSIILQTEQLTKCIITIILLLISAWLIRKKKVFFYSARL